MKEQLEAIRKSAIEQLQKAAALQDLDSVRIKFLGKKGELTAILKQMGKLSPEERPVIGQLANEIRSDLEEKISESVDSIKEKMLEEKLKKDFLLQKTTPQEIRRIRSISLKICS